MCRIHATHAIDRHVYTLPLPQTPLFPLPELYTYYTVLPGTATNRTRAYQRRALCFAPTYTLKQIEWQTPPAAHQVDRVRERVEQVRVYGAPLWWTSSTTLSSPLDIVVTWTMSPDQHVGFSHDWVTPSGVWVEAGIPLYYQGTKQPVLQATLYYTFTPGRITTNSPRHLELWDVDHKIWKVTHGVTNKAQNVLLPAPLQNTFVFETLHTSAPLLCALEPVLHGWDQKDASLYLPSAFHVRDEALVRRYTQELALWVAMFRVRFLSGPESVEQTKSVSATASSASSACSPLTTTLFSSSSSDTNTLGLLQEIMGVPSRK